MNKITKKQFILIGIAIFLVLLVPFNSKAADSEKLRQELEAQIRELQSKIGQYQDNIQENQQKGKSLQNEISILEDKISKIQLEIKQIDLSIQESNLNIGEIDTEIGGLEKEIGEKKELLAEYIRIVAEHDQETLLEIVLKKDNLSDFFEEINAIENAQEKVHTVLASIQGLKENLEGERENLEDELNRQYQLKSLQTVQRRSVQNQQNQKEDLLEQTKGEENRYQALIQDAEKNITHIKEQLSLLDKYGITLEDAVQNAIYASSKTGLRPAYLLGVLEAESRLGLNVGTGNWKKDMYQCYRSLGYITKAEQQKNAFFQICQELGLNPDTQPVSAEPWYGCGGAMGIGQFMPTTWLAYRDRVASLTGHNPPSPWNHLDGFMASAIKLSDAGANQRTEYSERKAYSIYLGGSNWSKWVNSKVTDYVIELAANFQREYFE